MINNVNIAGREIGPGQPPFIIAEACINHGGDFEVAKRMVYVAHAMGAECIKFQIHVLENEMLRQAPQSDNFDEPLWDTLERTNLSVDQHVALKNLCEQIGIQYLCTSFSRDGVDILDDLGVAFYKTGSGEMTNLPLIEHIASKGKPMVVSTGMCELDEIRETVNLVKSIGAPLVLTHCVSIYPCPYERVNLGLIPKYEQMFEVPVGLSDHSSSIYTGIGSAAYGACIIEKHFTLDRQQKGPDHPSSIEPYELGELVKGARAVYMARGSDRTIFPEERQIIEWAREAVVTEVNISKGDTIEEDMVWVKRPGPEEGSIPAKDLKKIVGKRAHCDIPKDVQMKWQYIEE